MKKLSYLSAAAALLLCVSSCFGGGGIEPNATFHAAIVTFRPQDDLSYYLKVNDDEALVVTNSSIQKYPFKAGQEKRALVSYNRFITEPAEVPSPKGIENYKDVGYVELATIDTMYILKPVAHTDDDIETYGHDPVGMYTDDTSFPRTCISDGYLTVCFTFPSNPYATEVKHDIYLVLGSNPDDPYEVVFRHNANNDLIGTSAGIGLVSFPLKDLPSTGGKEVTLTLKWDDQTTSQQEKVELKYKSRTDW